MWPSTSSTSKVERTREYMHPPGQAFLDTNVLYVAMTLGKCASTNHTTFSSVFISPKCFDEALFTVQLQLHVYRYLDTLPYTPTVSNWTPYLDKLKPGLSLRHIPPTIARSFAMGCSSRTLSYIVCQISSYARPFPSVCCTPHSLRRALLR